MGEIIELQDKRVKVNADRELSIATAPRRNSSTWTNHKMTWSALVQKASFSRDTGETLQEYKAMTKTQKSAVKDIGGFVGGELKGGIRQEKMVKCRHVLTLDADHDASGLPFDIDLSAIGDSAYCYYSTHTSTKKAPRYRILILLDRPVTAEEYKAISRKVADQIGMQYFDPVSFAPHQMMFWSSHPTDVDPVFEYHDGPALSADDVLKEYPDWKDISYWPRNEREEKKLRLDAEKQKDPLEKKGLIGAFCRAYTIPEAIDTFLSDVYEPTAKPDRYTYIGGTTAAGLVVYDDDRFAYSNHSTDPAGGICCNAFDLVRIHKFGVLDEPDDTGVKAPSFIRMTEFVQEDEKTVLLMDEERRQQIADDFSEAPEEDDVKWKTKLTRKKNGEVEATLVNLDRILKYDPKLQGIKYNVFASQLEVPGTLPWKTESKTWRDADDAQLESYLAKYYTEFPKQKVISAVTKIGDDRSYHPVRDYLRGLPPWDKVPRIDTLLIDYLGADDSVYTRQVTRKTLIAAVKRVMQPGCKFDTMLVLVGPQGVGKSMFATKLGRDWFTDSLNLTDTRDKTGAEKLQGNWIVEVGELAGMRKMDVETLKSFLSRADDQYRAAYGRITQKHPRQGILIGTTNAENGFLRDVTGGRRFWPVYTPGAIDGSGPWDWTDDDIDQFYAEALAAWKAGESILLDPAAERIAREMQKKAVDTDPREGIVIKYLETKLPEDWDHMDLTERRDWLNDDFNVGTVERTQVSNAEIWAECFGKPPGSMEHKDTYPITLIMEQMPGWEKVERQQRIPIYGKQRLYEKRNK